LLRQKESGKEVARAKTGMLFFDYEKGKVCPLTEPFKAAFL